MCIMSNAKDVNNDVHRTPDPFPALGPLSEDAVTLEAELHEYFAHSRVSLVLRC